jgi:signal peptidase I
MRRLFATLIITGTMTGMFHSNLLYADAAEEAVPTETAIVRGTSLSPLIMPSEEVKIFRGYYRDHPIERGDIVLVNYSGNKNPLIKIVKGLPQDRFALQKDDNETGWNILINNKVIKNSENKDYVNYGKKNKMLALYVKDYNGVIPENAYLVLGNVPAGSLDSTRFGLIDKAGIIAKVLYKK